MAMRLNESIGDLLIGQNSIDWNRITLGMRSLLIAMQFLLATQQFCASISSSAKLLLLYSHTHTHMHSHTCTSNIFYTNSLFHNIFTDFSEKYVYIKFSKNGDIMSMILNIKHNGKLHLILTVMINFSHFISLLIILNFFLSFMRKP